MGQKNRTQWRIDKRTQEDIQDRIEELASSYVPEWHFDRENPDIGSVIARIFAEQMAENIQRYNQVLDRYRREFVNMLGISLLPAKPAAATVLMELVGDTVPGTKVGKGTKLLAETGNGGEQIMFETTHSLYVTSSLLESVFMVQDQGRKIIPLKGHFAAPEIVEELPGQQEHGETEPGQEERERDLKPFCLFGSKKKGIEKYALLLYHQTVLDVEGNGIYVTFQGNEKLVQKIGQGLFRFYYLARGGLLPVEDVKRLSHKETVVLKKKHKNVRTQAGGRDSSLLVLVAEEPVEENYSVSRIVLWSQGQRCPAEFAGSITRSFDPESFDPFGDTLSLFQEFYVGHDEYFRKAGAVICLDFDVSYREHRIMDAPKEPEGGRLRIIKRRRRNLQAAMAGEARAEEVSFEYFNGIGWKKLNLFQEAGWMFADGNKGKYEISFLCPHDWQETEAGPYQGRCIRVQVLKADNCYMRPCIHRYPHVENLRVSFSYESCRTEPERLVSVAGTRKTDLTEAVKEGRPFLAFSKGAYTGDGLYLGFSRKMESGPISLFFQMEEGRRFAGMKCRFEYSSAKGFKQMKAADDTAGMSRSGMVMFMPREDMSAVTLEGKRRYWLRISPADPEKTPKDGPLPVIKDICLNGVKAANIETREEEDFYLEEISPGMSVKLGIPNILDVDLWVNEKGKHSADQMEQMMRENPDTVRGEYDILGGISSFYVKWQEADQLDDVPSRRFYMLDRLNGRLVFGDGIHAGLPSVLDHAAFKVTVRCCDGEKGNVEPGAIGGTLENLMFVDRVFNPAKAYGGSGMEGMESAVNRGAHILRSRKRLVSMEDYIQEIKNFSDTINQVRCAEGWAAHGKRKDGAVSFVILLKDFEAGACSFHSMAKQLKSRLMESCQMTLGPEDLYLTEPVFVSVSVEVWVGVPRMEDGFEVQSLVQEFLEQYLSPAGFGPGEGRKIGVMPKKSQLLMGLGGLKTRAVVRKLAAAARYEDWQGTHETDLDELEPDPFFVCRSGRHQVNIMISKEKHDGV